MEKALERLGDPRRRLSDRSAWFHERVAVDAVADLRPDSLRNALEGWSSTSDPVTGHDAAVVALLTATVLDPAVEDLDLWTRAFGLWRESVDREPFWMAVLQLEMEGGFPQPASLEDVRNARRSALEPISRAALDALRRAVIEERSDDASHILGVLKNGLPDERFDALCGEIAAHVWGTEAPEPGGALQPEPTPAESPAAEGSTPIPLDRSSERSDPPLEIRPGELWELWDDPDLDDPAAERPEPETLEPLVPAAPEARAVVEDEARDHDPDPVDFPPAPRPAQSSIEPGPDPVSSPHDGAESVTSAPVRPAPSAPVSAGAADYGPFRHPSRLPRALFRDHVTRGGLVLAAAIAVLVLLTVLPDGGGYRGANAHASDELLEIERRLERNDAALAEALVERHLLEGELALLDDAVDGYQTLVDDYERRIRRRLPADRAAHRRVVRQRDVMLERRRSALEEREALDSWVDSLERRNQRLVTTFNATQRSGGITSRDPSP